MKFDLLEGFDNNTKSIYEHIVKKPEPMDISDPIELSNGIIEDQLNTQLETPQFKQQQMLDKVKELSELNQVDVHTILAKKQHQKLDSLLEDIQRLQLQPTLEKSRHLALEDRIQAIEHQVGIEYIDVLPKLHAIEQAAKFVQQHEKLLANPQMVDLSRAQAISQIYQKYAPIKDALPQLMDRLNVIKQGQLLTNVNQQIVVQQTVDELKSNLKILKESTINLEKTILENQQLIKQHLERK